MYKRISDSGLDVQAHYCWIAVLYPWVKGVILAIANINVQCHLLIGGLFVLIWRWRRALLVHGFYVLKVWGICVLVNWVLRRFSGACFNEYD